VVLGLRTWQKVKINAQGGAGIESLNPDEDFSPGFTASEPLNALNKMRKATYI